MKANDAISTVILLALLSLLVGCGPSSVELRLTPAEGEIYRYEDTMNQEMIMEVQGLEITIRQSMTFVTSYEVIEVDVEGQITIEATYEQIVTEMASPFTGEVRFDSSDEAAVVPSEFEGLSRMVGQSLTLTLSPDGSLVDVVGVDELMAMITGPIPSSQPDLESLMQDLTSMFDENSDTGGITGLMGSFPEGEIAVGDTWERQIITEIPFETRNNVAYTVTSIKAGGISLQMEGETEFDMSEFMSNLGLGEMTFEMRGSQTGEILIDIATGMLVSSTIEQSLTGETEIYAADLGGDTTFLYTMTIAYERLLLEDE